MLDQTWYIFGQTNILVSLAGIEKIPRFDCMLVIVI